MKKYMLLYIFLCILFVSKNVTANVTIDNMDIDGVDSQDFDIEDAKNTTPRLTRIFSFISKGNDLKMQYKCLLPNLASLIKTDSLFNPFKLLSFVPYLVFAISMVNVSMDGKGNYSTQDIEQLNLASLLQNPKNLNNLFSNKDNSEFAIDAMKVLSGVEVSGIVDKLVEEVKEKAVENRNGVIGINGELLNDLLRNSSDFKSLFPSDDLANIGLNYLNAYMNILVSAMEKEKEKKNKVKTVRIHARSINLDVSNIAQDVFRGTLSDSVAAFFTIGQTKIHEIAGDNLQTLGNTSDSYVTLTGLKSLVFYKTPNTVLKYFSIASSLTTTRFFIPKLISYFLPFTINVDAFKFICLLTYVIILANRKSDIPNVGPNKIEVQGINTERIIDTLNNQEIMSNLIPKKHVPNYGVNIIKFLAGPDADLIDKLVKEFKRITTGTDENGNPKRLTITEVLKDTALFKKLYNMKENEDSIANTSTILEDLQLNNKIENGINNDDLTETDKIKNELSTSKRIKQENGYESSLYNSQLKKKIRSSVHTTKKQKIE